MLQIAKCGKARVSCVKALDYEYEFSNQSFVCDSVKTIVDTGAGESLFFFPNDLGCIS